MNRLKSLDEGILGEIGRVFAIRCHVVKHAKNSLPIFFDDPIECGDITGLNAAHNLQVSIGL